MGQMQYRSEKKSGRLERNNRRLRRGTPGGGKHHTFVLARNTQGTTDACEGGRRAVASTAPLFLPEMPKKQQTPAKGDAGRWQAPHPWFRPKYPRNNRRLRRGTAGGGKHRTLVLARNAFRVRCLPPPAVPLPTSLLLLRMVLGLNNALCKG
jgi:hypothetical protein